MWILITENICPHNNSGLLQIKVCWWPEGGAEANPLHTRDSNLALSILLQQNVFSLLALSPGQLQKDLCSKNKKKSISELQDHLILHIGFDVFVHRFAFRGVQVVHVGEHQCLYCI